MNLRPSGYEPDELPDCSTPHQEAAHSTPRVPENPEQFTWLRTSKSGGSAWIKRLHNGHSLGVVYSQ